MAEDIPSGDITEDQVEGFSWWICMLPFLVAVGVFVWKWYQNRADQSFLLYALVALFAGIVVSALFTNASKPELATTSGDRDTRAGGGLVTPTDSTASPTQD